MRPLRSYIHTKRRHDKTYAHPFGSNATQMHRMRSVLSFGNWAPKTFLSALHGLGFRVQSIVANKFIILLLELLQYREWRVLICQCQLIIAVTDICIGIKKNIFASFNAERHLFTFTFTDIVILICIFVCCCVWVCVGVRAWKCSKWTIKLHFP